MIKFIVCFSLVIALVAADYDFRDSDFNEILFKDLTDEIEDTPLRIRRGADNGSESTKCSKKKPKEEKDTHCCSGEKGNPQELEKLKEVKKQCIAEIRGESGTDDELGYDPLSCEGVEVMREKTICAAECVAKVLGLVGDNGDFKRDALLNHTSNLIGESRWKVGALEEYIDGCLNSIKEQKDEEKKKTGQFACHPSPLEFHHCIWRKFVEGCPAESQIDSKKCKKIRERLTKGDTSYAEKTFKKLFKRHH